MNTSELILTVDNQVAEMDRMNTWLDTELRRFELSSEVLFKFDLCANEIADNIIGYAFPEAGIHHITFRLTVTDTTASLEVEDDGIHFNPLDAPEHVRPASLEEAKIGGLGIYLTRHYMDECHYNNRDGNNILKITTNISLGD